MKKDILPLISEKMARRFVLDLDDDIRTAMYEWSSTLAKSKGGSQRKNSCFVVLNNNLVMEIRKSCVNLSKKLNEFIKSVYAEDDIQTVHDNVKMISNLD